MALEKAYAVAAQLEQSLLGGVYKEMERTFDKRSKEEQARIIHESGLTEFPSSTNGLTMGMCILICMKMQCNITFSIDDITEVSQ